MMRLLIVLAVLLAAALVALSIATPAWALQATYTYTLPTDPVRTGVRIERRDGPDSAAWTTKATLGAAVTSFNEAGLTTGMRYCYRAVTVGSTGDGPPNTPSCATPDVPLGAGTGTLLITP